MGIIEQSLKYLRESLSNYPEDNDMCQKISKRLEAYNYEREDEFVEDLNDEEVEYLNSLLAREIHYAQNAQDRIRVKELNDIYELLL